MGVRGPAPKPRLEVVRDGGEVRSQHRSQLVVPPGAPLEPDWADEFGAGVALAELASAEWGRIVPALDAARALSGLDRSVLADHCVTWAQTVELVRLVAAHGYVAHTERGPVRNPELLALQSQRQRLATTSKALGLSPADRARISSGSVDVPLSPEGYTL